MKIVYVFALFFTALGALPAASQDKSAFTSAQREELKTFIRDYLVKNPEVIAEAIGAWQEKEEADKEKHRVETIASKSEELFNPKEQTVIGNPKGDVTVVEFFDYNCGYCKSMFPDMIELIKSDGKIRLVMKELPILGPNSVTAAKAALASRNQHKYSEFHQALLGYKGPVNDAVITVVAKNVGLNVDQLKEDMKNPDYDAIIDANKDLARALNVTGTPALLIGDAYIGGAVNKERLADYIADARKKKKS